MPDLLPVARVSSNDRAGIGRRRGCAEARPVPAVLEGRCGRESQQPPLVGRHRDAGFEPPKPPQGQRRGRNKCPRQKSEATEGAFGNASGSCPPAQHTPRQARNLWTQLLRANRFETLMLRPETDD